MSLWHRLGTGLGDVANHAILAWLREAILEKVLRRIHLMQMEHSASNIQIRVPAFGCVGGP